MTFLNIPPAKQGAVFIPILNRAHGPELLFQIRTAHIPQGGEICFPGGMRNNGDIDLKATALRETAEELCLPLAKIVHQKHHGTYIDFVGRAIDVHSGGLEIASVAAIAPDENEVADLFSVPLSFFKTTEMLTAEINVTYDFDGSTELLDNLPDRFHKPRHYKRSVCGWLYEGKLIWGITAEILKLCIDSI